MRVRGTHIVTHERGNFMGELAAAIRATVLGGRNALTDVEAIAISASRLRTLLIAEANLRRTVDARSDPSPRGADRSLGGTDRYR